MDAGGTVGRSVRAVVLAAAALAVFMTLMPSTAGARQMLRGRALGTVTGFDEDRFLLMVDIGSEHGVLRGVPFAVVDKHGSQVAVIEAGEVFGDLFWSAPLAPEEFRNVRYDMQVRWLFTPEISALLHARDKDTPEEYRAFLEKYPDGKLAVELIRSLRPSVMRGLDPEFFDAWEDYTAESLGSYAASHPTTALGRAAGEEAASIKEYEAASRKKSGEADKAGAPGADGAGAGRGAVVTGADEPFDPFNVSYRGRLVNNSTEMVYFEFDPPGRLPRTPVQPLGSVDTVHAQGTFTFKVFAPREDFGSSGFDSSGFGATDFGMDDGIPDDQGINVPGLTQETPAETPIGMGSVNIDRDMWEAVYP